MISSLKNLGANDSLTEFIALKRLITNDYNLENATLINKINQKEVVRIKIDNRIIADTGVVLSGKEFIKKTDEQ